MLRLWLVALALLGPARAAEFEVRMLNRGADGAAMVFEPSFLRVEPGDTIRFVATTAGHNVMAIDGMLPEGVAPFRSTIDADFTLTVTRPGLYGVKCLPHYTMGMVALLQVGPAPVNLDAARTVRLPRRAGERMAAALAQVR